MICRRSKKKDARFFPVRCEPQRNVRDDSDANGCCCGWMEFQRCRYSLLSLKISLLRWGMMLLEDSLLNALHLLGCCDLTAVAVLWNGIFFFLAGENAQSCRMHPGLNALYLLLICSVLQLALPPVCGHGERFRCQRSLRSSK